jgi:TetR/AcrR family transcriptional regulator, regulator of autoinduction and epiphytic fitness
MKSMPSTSERTRRERVLTAALEVFGRYGFRKTSMDDVARAAGISRQGLYLHFASKEALFRAAVRQEFDTALAEASRCLDEEGAALDQRVIAALDAWLGRYVGSMLAPDISGLLQDPAVQIEDMVDGAMAAFDARLANAIAAATAEEDAQRGEQRCRQHPTRSMACHRSVLPRRPDRAAGLGPGDPRRRAGTGPGRGAVSRWSCRAAAVWPRRRWACCGRRGRRA